MLTSLRWLPFVMLLAPVGSNLPVGRARQVIPPPATPPLVFDGVTVIDVAHGERIPAQRVVIIGNRITNMDNARAVPLPAGARVVDARGKYLIPGLWDMHTHSLRETETFYPLFIANGVTGIRDAASMVPLDTLRLWRREIGAGTRVGPPRQVLAGPAIDENTACNRKEIDASNFHTCVADAADARHVVDSLKSAGADFIKTYALGRQLYFVIAAEARRVGLLFGGHLGGPLASEAATGIEASDSGASFLDHTNTAGDMEELCWGPLASVERCQPVAATFRKNTTGWVPTMLMVQTQRYEYGDAVLLQIDGGSGISFSQKSERIFKKFYKLDDEFHSGAVIHPGWLRDSASGDPRARSPQPATPPDAGGYLHIVQRVGLPVLAGTDVTSDMAGVPQPPGFSLHAELALLVAEGMTPLAALQSATLNPAIVLHETDSLGTVASGKLADLVLLDADPLVDITNTTTIRAVVANGRYFDRAALDQLTTTAQANALRADSSDGTVLTTELLTKVGTFWQTFKKEPPAVQDTGMQKFRYTVMIRYIGKGVFIVGGDVWTDWVAMAGSYPSVAAAFKQAGLTPEQFNNFKLTLYETLADEDLGLGQDTGDQSTQDTKKARHNVSFLHAHPQEVDSLKATGLPFQHLDPQLLEQLKQMKSGQG